MRELDLLRQEVLDGDLDAIFRHDELFLIPPNLRIHIEISMPPGGMPDRKKLAGHGRVWVVQTS